jgi:hypothetical protein
VKELRAQDVTLQLEMNDERKVHTTNDGLTYGKVPRVAFYEFNELIVFPCNWSTRLLSLLLYLLIELQDLVRTW